MNLNEVISNQEVNVDASNEGAYHSFDSAPVSRDRPYSSSEISAREVTCVRNQMAYYLPNRPQILPARAAVVKWPSHNHHTGHLRILLITNTGARVVDNIPARQDRRVVLKYKAPLGEDLNYLREDLIIIKDQLSLMRRLGGCNVSVVEPAFLAEHGVFWRFNPDAESWPSPPD